MTKFGLHLHGVMHQFYRIRVFSSKSFEVKLFKMYGDFNTAVICRIQDDRDSLPDDICREFPPYLQA
jgi:hypothetical protein